jgi:hypothetical protein
MIAGEITGRDQALPTERHEKARGLHGEASGSHKAGGSD